MTCILRYVWQSHIHRMRRVAPNKRLGGRVSVARSCKPGVEAGIVGHRKRKRGCNEVGAEPYAIERSRPRSTRRAYPGRRRKVRRLVAGISSFRTDTPKLYFP